MGDSVNTLDNFSYTSPDDPWLKRKVVRAIEHATGPLVVAANHPFGVQDGVVSSHLVHRMRKDFLVLTNEVLTRAEELRPFLLPIDFVQTPQVLQTNLNMQSASSQ